VAARLGGTLVLPPPPESMGNCGGQLSPDAPSRTPRNAGPRPRARTLTALALILVAALTAPVPGVAEPLPGRSWTAVETTLVAGYTGLLPDFMYLDDAGAPLVYANTVGGLGRNFFALRWADSAWVPKWSFGFGTAYARRVHAPPGRRLIVFEGNRAVPGFERRVGVILTEDLGNGYAAFDTVTHTDPAGSFDYAAAFSSRRKWAAFQDYLDLRLMYSDTLHVWREIEVPGRGDAGIALAAEDDTTALLAWGENFHPVRWGYVRGTRFEEGPPPPNREWSSWLPVIVPRKDGGFWMAWSTDENHISMARLHGTEWVAWERLDCNYQPPGNYYTIAPPELVARDSVLVAIGWSGWASQTYRHELCLTCASESGFPLATQLVSTPDAAPPRLAADRNGDVWVAWFTEALRGMYWYHSYVRATAASLTAIGSTAARTVRWTLSEPAPGSWWAVLRAPPGGAFEEVARVPAGDGVEVAWRDDAPAPDTLRYRVRRESVDRRYEWLSDETVWALDPTPAQVSLFHTEAAPDRVRLVWAGAGAGGLAAAVERRTEAEDWRALGAAFPDGPDRLACVDTTVLPGTRYAYRLAYTEDGVERRTAEAWVEVPRALELALEGLRPNPSAGRPQVAFTLPAAGRARIELLDVAGRRVLRHDAGVLPAGRHVVDLAAAARLAPGVYLVRLESGGRTAQARSVVIR